MVGHTEGSGVSWYLASLWCKELNVICIFGVRAPPPHLVYLLLGFSTTRHWNTVLHIPSSPVEIEVRRKNFRFGTMVPSRIALTQISTSFENAQTRIFSYNLTCLHLGMDFYSNKIP